MAEITHIAVKIGDAQVILTLEEAKELHAVLGELFSAKTKIVEVPAKPSWPNTWPWRGPYWEAKRDNTSGAVSITTRREGV